MKAVLCALAVVMVSQVAVSVQDRPGGIAGAVWDADGGTLPGVAVELSTTRSPEVRKVTSNPRGRFELAELQAGEYQVALSLRGFKTAHGVVHVRAGAVSPVTFQMALGSLQEYVTIQIPASAAAPPTQVQPGSAAPIRVGGDIQEPRKIRDVKPVYPTEAMLTGAEGRVQIEAVIGKDGSVASARVVQGVPTLNAAALEAVRQWVYTPTRLNGAPVDISMSVTVVFAR